MCVPISCAICTSWSPITLTVTGSTSRARRPARRSRAREPQDPVGEHAQLLAREDERRRVELLDDRRAAELGAGRQVLAPVDRRREPAAPAKRTSRTLRGGGSSPSGSVAGAGRAPGPSAVTLAWISSIVSPGKL